MESSRLDDPAGELTPERVALPGGAARSRNQCSGMAWHWHLWLSGGVPPHVPRTEPSVCRDSIRWPGRMWPRRDPMKVPASVVLCGRLAPHPHVGFCSLHEAPGSARVTEGACRPVRAGRFLHQRRGVVPTTLEGPSTQNAPTQAPLSQERPRGSLTRCIRTEGRRRWHEGSGCGCFKA